MCLYQKKKKNSHKGDSLPIGPRSDEHIRVLSKASLVGKNEKTSAILHDMSHLCIHWKMFPIEIKIDHTFTLCQSRGECLPNFTQTSLPNFPQVLFCIPITPSCGAFR
jgi:hypothetical protein